MAGLLRDSCVRLRPRYRPNSSAQPNGLKPENYPNAKPADALCVLHGSGFPLVSLAGSLRARERTWRTNGVTRLSDRCRSNEVRRSHQLQSPGRQILNLGMPFSVNVPNEIDLCAMVWSISRDYAFVVSADVSSGRTNREEFSR